MVLKRGSMKEILSDTAMIAYCGLYCGACKRYLKGSCPGCQETEKASWCKVRACCVENAYCSCADCKEFLNPKDCNKYNTLLTRFFSFIFRSNRAACIGMIREDGYQEFADTMTERKLPTIKP